ncbi:C39 family peptidase [Tumidithrix elongata RA019]|uniref:C39 family peptidase n=1 Tax=Tumidithrix elongata BACA0141 TaxID=2716417 RepID=A0AAW9PVA6_9CYAN|nr:C39 family peptidase [Tumidithrix elongata RA019]
MTNSTSKTPTLDAQANKTITIDQTLTEVNVNTPFTIGGKVDLTQIAKLRVLLTDNSVLSVEIDYTKGIWRAKSINGFTTFGSTNLRILGLDASDRVLSSQVLSIVVKPPAIVLVVKQDTLFKASPADSSTLPINAKAQVKAGQTIVLSRYGLVDGHIKVTLPTAIPPVGNFGYFYAPHVDIRSPITLTTKQDTVFKASTAASGSLGFSQKSEVKAGSSFLLDGNYTLENNHVKVTLTTPIPPLGKVGYFFAPHVDISKLNSSIPLAKPEVVADITAKGTILTIKTATFFKASPENASDLKDDGKVMLQAGATYPILGYAAINGHFRVKLANPIAPVGTVGFLYWQHVSLSKDGKVMAFDPDMKTMTVKQNTFFKAKAIDSSQLGTNEKANLTAAQIYGLDRYSLSGTHFQVTLNENIAPVGTQGYVFAPHVTLMQGNKPIEITPDRKVLSVPYFSQRDNPRDPFVTCNVTSISMVLYYHGIRSRSGGQLEDELYQWIIDRYGANARSDNSVLAQLYNAYGFGGGFGTSRTWAQITAEISANRPVVIGGYFTHGGHIICLIGYDTKGYIVNDPYGDALSGYTQTEGASLNYSFAYMQDMCGADGDVWAHFIVPKS